VKEPGGATVPVVGLLAGLYIWKVEPHRVCRVAGEQLLLELRPDHVIRRAYDAAQISHLLGIVAKRAKGSNLWHVAP